jgi:ribosomal protein S12 methylthiotransferase accessory factor
MTAVLADVPPTPLDDALARLDRLVSAEAGIVRRVERFLAAPPEGGLVRAAAEVVVDERLLGQSLEHLRGGGGGYGPTWEHARAAAIGEAAERYSATFVPDGLVAATAAELGPGALEPERFALFHPRQHVSGFPFEPFTRSTRVRWARGFALPDGDPVDVPAQLVYLAWPPDPSEPRVAHATSNGLACGPTLEEALLGGLLEAVERDAFMLTWNARHSPPLLEWHRSPGLRALHDRFFAGTGGDYECVDLSWTLGVPVVAAVVRGGDGVAAALCVGAAAAPTVEEAWLKALGEAFAVRVWASLLLHAAPRREFAADFRDVTEFADHIHLYALPEHAHRARFLTASRQRRDVADVAPLPGDRPLAQLDAVCALLAERGLRAYAVDVTAPDIGAAGLRVAKVIVPELCPLDVNHRARYLGGERLRCALRELGLRERPLELDDVNPDPHPFP